MIPVTEVPSDERLASALRAGDEGALAELFRRHADGLLQLACRITGTREDAEDVVQDVFLGLARAVQRYEEREAFTPWLRRVTARRALMQLRSSARAAVRDQAAAGLVTVANEGERMATAIALSDAIERLPDRLRRVFVLCDVEGFSHADAAELIGITVAASRARRCRAVAILQSVLGSSR